MKQHALNAYTRLITTAALFSTLTICYPAMADDAAPAAPNYGIQYNGLIDGYYLFQTNNPKHTGVITGITYNVRHNTPTLALAELNVLKNPKPHAFGFKATLMAGDDTDINHFDFDGASHGVGEARFKAIQQLYGTYALSPDGGSVDFGKFGTPFGYELIEASGNNNYSHSLIFAIEPTYHSGARISTPPTALGVKGLVATGFLVRAIYNTQKAGVQDDNGQPAYLGQLIYTDPKGKYSLTSTLGLGKDKFDYSGFTASDTNTREILNDDIVTYTVNDKISLGLNYIYANFRPENAPKITTNGVGLYYHQTLTPKTGFALRWSGTQTKIDDGSQQAKPYEATATYLVKPAANFQTFFEYRHDGTNVDDSFLDSSGQATKKTQDTFTIAGAFTF